MSENQKKVEVFKEDGIIDVKVSVMFLKRIQNIFLSVIDSYNERPVELKNIIDKIKQGNQVLEPDEENLETLIILINTLEEEARKQSLSSFENLNLKDS